MIIKLVRTCLLTTILISCTSHTHDLEDFLFSPLLLLAQRVLNALVGHSAAYSQTLEAGRKLYDAATDWELQTRLQTELQDLEKAWDKTQSGLEQRCELVHKGVQVRPTKKKTLRNFSLLVTSYLCFLPNFGINC